MTYCHVIIGEVVPKNLAIAKADRLAVVVAPVLTVLTRILSPFVNVVERSAGGITRMMGVRDGHTPRRRPLGRRTEADCEFQPFSGILPSAQEDMIHRVLDLEEVSVREVMKPRHDIASVPADATLDEVLEAMVVSQHSRLPVWEGAPEHMVGVVFFKDMLRVWHERRASIRQGGPRRRFTCAASCANR